MERLLGLAAGYFVTFQSALAPLVHGLIVLLAGTLQPFLAAPQRREMAGNIFAIALFSCGSMAVRERRPLGPFS